MYRKMKYGDEELEADQTDVVVEEMEMKIVPQIAIPPVPQPTATVPTPTPSPSNPSGDGDRGIAPLPPTGLPSGWTQQQWDHFGWQYIDSLSQ